MYDGATDGRWDCSSGRFVSISLISKQWLTLLYEKTKNSHKTVCQNALIDKLNIV